MNKTPLLRARMPVQYNVSRHKGHFTEHMTSAPPFVISKRAELIHRPRSGMVHYDGFKVSHVSISCWCGSLGYVVRHRPNRVSWELTDRLPENAVVCATCEGRAIGAGILGAPEIAGHAVKFSPRNPL